MSLAFFLLPILVRNHFSTANELNNYPYKKRYLYSPIELSEDSFTKLDIQKPVKCIIHGYLEDSTRLRYKQMISEYLKKGDYNVIQVDWSKLASQSYPKSAYNTQIVGGMIGTLIINMHKHGLPLSNIHLIGHSLGAHVSGHAGKKVFRVLGKKIGRITGLDPAGPLFEIPSFVKGLNKNDADIVDCIHTDGGIFGYKESLCTVDFYPNGGVRPQPGCFALFMLLKSYRFIDIAVCSHQKSVYYFTDSINRQVYIGQKCRSWLNYVEGRCVNVSAIMGDGYVRKPHEEGDFYLQIA